MTTTNGSMKKITLIFKARGELEEACAELNPDMSEEEQNDWYERTQRFMNGDYLFLEIYENGRYELVRHSLVKETTR